MTDKPISQSMSPQELEPIVRAWGGVKKFAKLIGVGNRTVSYWLAGTHPIRPPIAKLIRSLKPRKPKHQPKEE